MKQLLHKCIPTRSLFTKDIFQINKEPFKSVKEVTVHLFEKRFNLQF